MSLITKARNHPAAIARVVLDTNVGLALFAFGDESCAALLAALRSGQLQAVANAVARSEWSRVLQRAELRLDATRRIQAAQMFDALVTVISTDAVAGTDAVTLPRCRDPDDQIFLELARDSGAAVLYSRDRELLKLSRQTQRRAGFVVLRPQDYRA